MSEYATIIVDKHSSAESQLWQTVIDQALSDLKRAREGTPLYDDVRNWFWGAGSRFVRVCDMANMDADYVRSLANEVLEKGYSRRARAGTGRRHSEYQKRKRAESRMAIEINMV